MILFRVIAWGLLWDLSVPASLGLSSFFVDPRQIPLPFYESSPPLLRFFSSLRCPKPGLASCSLLSGLALCFPFFPFMIRCALQPVFRIVRLSQTYQLSRDSFFSLLVFFFFFVRVPTSPFLALDSPPLFDQTAPFANLSFPPSA